MSRCAIADFLFAAWFEWMTPLLTALSSWREACRNAVDALSLSPDSAASRKLRMAVLSELLTLLLRSRAASLVRIRLIWDLMFATKLPQTLVDWVSSAAHTGADNLARLPAARLRAQIVRTGR